MLRTAAGPARPDAAATRRAAPGPGRGAGEEAIQASITDLAAMTEACQGADAVIHLGGLPGEAPWDQIMEINIDGTYAVFEAARRAGVPRVIYASSNHAVGFTPRSAFPVPDYAFPAPGHLLRGVQGGRRGAGRPVPLSVRPGRDLPAHPVLRRAAARPCGRCPPGCPRTMPGGCSRPACPLPSPGFRVAFGVSANTRGGWVSLDEARALGYEPQDDAETYAAELIAAQRRARPGRPGPGLPGRGVHPPRP